MEARVGVDGLHKQSIPAGTPLRLALKGGEVLSLETPSDTEPIGQVAGQAVATGYKVIVPVTPASLAKLASKPIVAVQFKHGDVAFERDVGEDMGADLQTVAICFYGDFGK
jgi:hypothetical protein